MTNSHKDASLPVDVRVDQLIGDMTIEEKASQLTSIWAYEVLDNTSFNADKAKHRIGSGIGQITRIGGATNLGPQQTAEVSNSIQKFLLEQTRLEIPAIVHEESCSGYMAKGATCFPQTIGIASTWEAQVAKKVGQVIRRQMRAAGAHQALAPLLDVTRDPRWGRVEETFGEDPFLVAQMGMQYVQGLQGENLSDGVVATGKHFVGYGISEGGMNWAPAHIPERELREVYLHPFEAVVRAANLGSIMPGYHELDGVPCHHSKHLLVDILRNTWGFDGIVVSDYFAINQLYEYHRVAKSKEQAAAFGVEAGVDVELPSKDVYDDALIKAVEHGMVGIEAVDQLVRRVLTLKFQLGLFEHPYVDTGSTLAAFDNKEQRQLAKETAQKSIVLLKNENSFLPLSKSTQNVAVIGPNGNNIRNLVGDYAYPCHIESLLEMRDDDNVFDTPMPAVMEVVDQFVPMRTIFEAIRDKVASTATVRYAQGCDVTSADESHVDEAVRLAEQSDVAIAIVGDRAGLTDWCTTGESRDSSSIRLQGIQERLVKRLLETGTPTVVVFVSGRPLAESWIAEHATAIVNAWLPGEEGADAVADVLFGDFNPAGRLPITVPKSVGQVPIYYGHKPSGGRSHWKGSYVDESNLPLYAFGHGLSYAKFEYANLQMSTSSIDVHGQIDLTCTVSNVGDCDGEEVVQLYTHDAQADVTRPVLELRGFCRIPLKAGESRRVTFTLSAHQLGFYNRSLQFVVEPGEIEVHIGAASNDIRLNEVFHITGTTTDVENHKVFSTPVRIG